MHKTKNNTVYRDRTKDFGLSNPDRTPTAATESPFTAISKRSENGWQTRFQEATTQRKLS
jgi:hypothetical protein